MESLSQDIIQCIVNKLPQRDAMSLISCCKHMGSSYPRHISKTFKTEDTIQEYIFFMQWLAVRPLILSLRVVVNPILWNEAVDILDKWTTGHISIFPTEVRFIGIPPHMPRCDTMTYGFVDGVVCAFDDHTVWIRDPRSLIEGCPSHILPEFTPETGIQRLSCFGMKGILRLPKTLTSVGVICANLSQPDIEHLATFEGQVSIVGCRIHGCIPTTFAAEYMDVDDYVLDMVSEAPRCTKMRVWVSGEPMVVRNMFPFVTEIVVTGVNFSNLTVVQMIYDMFPNAQRISYNTVLVDPQ